jgi:hypothetical protein
VGGGFFARRCRDDFAELTCIKCGDAGIFERRWRAAKADLGASGCGDGGDGGDIHRLLMGSERSVIRSVDGSGLLKYSRWGRTELRLENSGVCLVMISASGRGKTMAGRALRQWRIDGAP